ncbi:MAG: hypothetical protein ACOYEB_03685 [Enterococcus lemanii]|jgi:hypothetical protein
MTILFSAISVILSTFAFLFTLKNEWTKRVNLNIQFLDSSMPELKVDRTEDIIPDVYHQSPYRLFPTVVITNNSSLPITITEFKLNNGNSFGFYSKVGTLYETTYKTNQVDFGNGITATTSGSTEKVIVEFNETNLLKPPLTIKPYESVVGVLFFHYKESIIGNNQLKALTSRGEMEFPLQVSKQYISRLKTDYIPPNTDLF